MVAAGALSLRHQLFALLQRVDLADTIIAQRRIQTERRDGLRCVLESEDVALLSIEGTPTEVRLTRHFLDARERVLVAYGVPLLRALLEVVLAHAVRIDYIAA